MTRVISIINSLDLGGAETSLYNLLKSTKGEVDHKVVTLIGGGILTSDIESLGISVVEAGLVRNNNSFRKVYSLIRSIRAMKPDVLCCHMYNANIIGALVSRSGLGRIANIWNIHHSVEDIKYESRSIRRSISISRIILSSADRIVYVSESGRRDHERLGFDADRSLVIPNGYDIEKFQFSAVGRTSVRAELGIAEQDFAVALAARMHPMKDHAGFLQALAMALALNPRIVAVICGQGTENLQIPDRLRDRVRVLGARRDIINVMSACDVGCLSSSFGEAFPNVLSEFMSCERPCVATDVGDAARIVSRYGLVVPPRNPAALADALVKMAAYSSEELRSMGAEGRNSIGKRFSIDSVAARHLQLWKQAAVSRG